MAYSGTYTPKHVEKYLGDPRRVFYRSLWEYRFMRRCDDTPGIVKWSSEEIVIPYVKPTDGQVHRYFPDFRIDVKTTAGPIHTSIIEIKPRAQCRAPKARKKTRKFLKEVMTYEINEAKWAAARQFCALRGWSFVVLDEYHLGIKK
jgi:hypothetical protein